MLAGFLPVYAADQNAAVLQAIQGIQASLNDIRLQLSAARADIKNDRAAMIARTGAGAQKTADLAVAVAAEDPGNQAQVIASEASRIGAIEAIEQRRDAADKAWHDSVMGIIKPTAATSIAGTLGFLGVAGWTAFLGWRHRRRMEESQDRVEEKVAATEANTNHLTTELIKLTAKDSKREGKDEERAEEHARRQN